MYMPGNIWLIAGAIQMLFIFIYLFLLLLLYVLCKIRYFPLFNLSMLRAMEQSHLDMALYKNCFIIIIIIM
jgi:hypothetical protein